MADAYEQLGPLPGEGAGGAPPPPLPPLPPPPPPPPLGGVVDCGAAQPMPCDPYQKGALGEDDNVDLDSVKKNVKGKDADSAEPSTGKKKKKKKGKAAKTEEETEEEEDAEASGKKKKGKKGGKGGKKGKKGKKQEDQKSPCYMVCFFVSLLIMFVGLTLLIFGALHMSGSGFIESLKTS